MTPSTVLVLIPVGFLATVLWAPRPIDLLRELKYGKQIRLEGPRSHLIKAGTPTMGGFLFIVTPILITLIVEPDWATIAPALTAIVAFGIAGALDDYANLKNKQGLGFKVRYKFLWHGLIALAISVWLGQVGDLHRQNLPGGGSVDLGGFFIPFVAIAIFSTTAGVNIVDGLDGLAAGTSFFALGAYLIIALGADLLAPAVVAATTMGALLGFLWFNVHPARIFMGDTGALALGAGLCVVAVQTQWLLLLPIIGLVLVIDLVSVILQVGYFRFTHGRRLFRMAPIHHGLEESGWPETVVIGRFWILGLLAASVGVALTW